jgi:hypothetical protein
MSACKANKYLESVRKLAEICWLLTVTRLCNDYADDEKRQWTVKKVADVGDELDRGGIL